MKNLLVTGVGAIIGYGIARSARLSKYPVKIVGMDMAEDAVGQKWCDVFVPAFAASDPGYPNFLRELIAKHEIDLVLPGIEQDVTRMSAERESFRDSRAKFALPPVELLRLASDKWLTHRALVEAGFPTIPTRIEGRFAELAKEFGAPFLLKPRRSYASKGIATIHDERDLEYWRSKTADRFMVQKIVGNDAEEFAVGMFGLGDGRICNLSVLQRRLSREGATVKARTVTIPELETRVRDLAKLFRPEGPTNMQFRRDGKDYLLLETNPRFSSSCSLRTAFGRNDVEFCIEYYLQGKTPAERDARSGRAIRYIEDLVDITG